MPYKDPEKEKAYHREYRRRNAHKFAEYSRAFRDRTTPEKSLWLWARKRARARGINFNIDLDDIVIPDLCPILGIKLEKSSDHVKPESPTLDRIDNQKGYIKGNVAVISWRANSIKKDATLEEVRAIARYMEQTNDA